MHSVHCLRAVRVFPAVRSALAVSSHGDFRITMFTVQRDHVHLIAEASDRETLTRGVQGLAIRIARAVNRALGRRGAVWADRYHARPLTTPRVVRNAMVYVLMNFVKHGIGRGIDRCSSAPWFDGWRVSVRAERARAAPVSQARTWLGRIG